MVSYKTIFGKEINFAQLSAFEFWAIQIIFALAEVNKRPFAFASRVKNFFFPGRFYCGQLMEDSVVGEIYRDQFYLLCSKNIAPEDEQYFLEQIRFNPLRLVLDCYLCGIWKHQDDFSRDAGISPPQVNRIFKNVLGERKSGEMSAKTLAKVFKNLGITPCFSTVKIKREQGFSKSSCDPSVAERLLILIVGSLARRLQQVHEEAEILACRDTLAIYLGFLYGIDDFCILTDFIDKVLRDILTVTRPVTSVNRKELFEMISAPDATSFKLLAQGCFINLFGIPQSRQIEVPECLGWLTKEEIDAYNNRMDSELSIIVQEAWIKAKERTEKWSKSPLAQKYLNELISDLGK